MSEHQITGEVSTLSATGPTVEVRIDGLIIPRWLKTKVTITWDGDENDLSRYPEFARDHDTKGVRDE